MCNQIHRRSEDGIHWNPDAVRMQTNIIMTFFCNSRGLKLPGRVNPTNPLLRETFVSARAASTDFHPESKIPQNRRPRRLLAFRLLYKKDRRRTLE